MTKYIFLIILLFSNCKSDNDCSTYPPIIKESNLQSEYDIVRWYCYSQYAFACQCIEWDKQHQKTNNLTLIGLEILPDSIVVQGEYLVFYIHFFDEKLGKCKKIQMGDIIKKPIHEIGFHKKANRVEYFVDIDKDHSPRFTEQEIKTLRTSMAIGEILENPDSVNCWFRAMALKKLKNSK